MSRDLGDAPTAESVDPLLQPLQLKHLRLRKRNISTSHEPACAARKLVNDPGGRYRPYRIGDAVASRNYCGAMCDAHRIALSV